MSIEVCRAITFINYHIPIVLENEIKIQYSTVGFFDGMLTEKLEFSYEQDELKKLWKYGLHRTASSMGQYSYQNIFCFSRDEWNGCRDEVFWKEETNNDYPLTFVVFLQLREYCAGKDDLGKKCITFRETIEKHLGTDGLSYVYCTVDKNDFVVCIKCRQYQEAVIAIKALHGTGIEVIYSYSVFSVSNQILPRLQEDRFQYLFDQIIASICLKGITNSYDPEHKVSLDQKYYEFCIKLLQKLFGKNYVNEDFKIYDILGDDDFRLIVRKVNLGTLLQQFAPGGVLSYREKSFQFYLFSSSLVLNTRTGFHSEIGEAYRIRNTNMMEREFQSPICNRLQSKMSKITEMVLTDSGFANEKVVTFCHAIWQLLQSLKTLETAPAKKYDFWSLYQPLSLMIEILEEKMEIANVPDYESEVEDISENAEIYDFIHKISMTLHGTLRTDIQFFQIRDFNVIVHYAPAKLRAFYSLWALQLSEYYNSFCPQKKRYSFIFSPGMFRETSVKQLFTNYEEDMRLMLITVPERHIYAPKWLSIILAHEVSHFVGSTVRNREMRHRMFWECCARVLILEMNTYRYHCSMGKWQSAVEKGIKCLDLFEELEEQLSVEEALIRNEKQMEDYAFHSEYSFEIIKEAFRNISRNYLEKMIAGDCERMNSFLQTENNKDRQTFGEKIKTMEEIRVLSYDMYDYLLAFYQKFQHNLLPQLLEILRYITSEAYADLSSILSLNLTPSEYLYSFREGEPHFCMNVDESLQGLLLYIRAGITMKAVRNVVMNKHSCFSQTYFEKVWSDDVFRRLPLELPKDSAESRIALNIYGYVTGIRNCNDSIRCYESLYCYVNGEEDFVNRNLDFFNDEIIWELITEYLEKCAKDYMDILEADTGLQKKKSELVLTYEKIAGDSTTELAQTIEDFLAGYEAEMKNTYNKV